MIDPSPFSQLNEFEQRTKEALDSLKQRGLAKLAIQKMDQEDAILGGLTQQLKSGKSLYSPEVMTYAMALASTRHAPALPLIEQAAKAGIPEIIKTGPGEKATQFNKLTGRATEIPGATNPPLPHDEFPVLDIGGEPTQMKIGNIPGQVKPAYQVPLGKAFRAGADFSSNPTVVKAIADSKRNLTKSQKDIQDFESNPTLVQQYQKIISDPKAQEAIGQAASSGDLLATGTILAKLLGDSTPERVLTKRFMNYMRAVDSVEGEKAYLKEFGVKVDEPKKQKPKKASGF